MAYLMAFIETITSTMLVKHGETIVSLPMHGEKKFNIIYILGVQCVCFCVGLCVI